MLSQTSNALWNLLRMSCNEAQHQRYCCFNLSSLPAHVLSFGYKTMVMLLASLDVATDAS